ncbi:hypothetical protein O181_092800 [Austropuccinia psidii MF-1]|uniref:Uncharacterized protein n=1 Tax=Austropuccinia psidii MF-1 TaxID=1389203 RepID=A0A9Q3P9I1_9BASI|nr:hypothetical protein [Austropuccinia psidii MF-1]
MRNQARIEINFVKSFGSQGLSEKFSKLDLVQRSQITTSNKPASLDFFRCLFSQIVRPWFFVTGLMLSSQNFIFN